MKIIVTGSSGMIGTRLCERLLKGNHKVIGVDWKPNAWQSGLDALTQRVDLRREEEIATLPSDIDCIIHLAANARVYELVKSPDLARDNFLTTFNTLEFARRNNIRKFIFASSRECYGNSEAPKYREDMVRVENCESAYTASKIAGEALTEAYRRCYGIDTVIIRFSNVYGMYDNSDRVVPLFIRQAQANEPLTVFGEDKSLDFTYIDDAVNGVLLALEKFDAARGNTFNIASGKATTVMELAELVKRTLKSSSSIKIKPSRTGEVTHYTADISRAQTILGFKPEVTFGDGMKETIEWYLTNT